MEDIGRYLAEAEQDYDIVFLQEVWARANYLTIKNLLTPKLPHSQYFDNGFMGTGTAIFAKVNITDCTFHEFGLNGYPHRLQHSDWFGGKGLGICRIDYLGFNIHLFTSHYHANYDVGACCCNGPDYLTHRIVQSVESAQWMLNVHFVITGLVLSGIPADARWMLCGCCCGCQWMLLRPLPTWWLC